MCLGRHGDTSFAWRTTKGSDCYCVDRSLHLHVYPICQNEPPSCSTSFSNLHMLKGVTIKTLRFWSICMLEYVWSRQLLTATSYVALQLPAYLLPRFTARRCKPPRVNILQLEVRRMICPGRGFYQTVTHAEHGPWILSNVSNTLVTESKRRPYLVVVDDVEVLVSRSFDRID